ncbi:hypothetical protein ATPR_1285 [Acetobacter tropicalis NBRC 101654]|uniref:Uncharacterized protein n=1 Tax=Acetobacter tropicalis NBRC 101654 TaxID=749388 RepID=F7VD36_9PROT|nr:hypothetical protein ATPR_1285 [Acetobacter tropicalis NBRC 101654]
MGLIKPAPSWMITRHGLSGSAFPAIPCRRSLTPATFA